MDRSPEQGSHASAELAEIDRRLALLRLELAPGPPSPGTPTADAAPAGPAPAGPAPSPSRGRGSGPLARVLARERSTPRGTIVELRAQPFADPEAVRAFVRLLGELRAVADVRLVGYEGADRAILEVTVSTDEGARRAPTESA
jgi:hypothetical protein